MHRHRRLVRLAILWTVVAAACADPAAPGDGDTWAQVGAGDRFSCALTSSGTAWCWGSGVFGQLGNDDVVSGGTPVRVHGDHVFRTIAVGSDHACGLDEAGAAWCWGLNDFRELGEVTGRCNPALPFFCADHPVRVAGGLSFDSIAVAGYSTCALTSAAEAWCWGWNVHGQVGSGAVGAVVAAPVAVGGGRLFASLTLDISHACGVTVAGALFCWGSNIHAALAADTTQTPRCGAGTGFFCTVTPVASATSLQVQSVSAGSSHTCAVTTATEAWCWGSNQYGVLGNAATQGGRTPVIVTGGLLFRRVSAGADHTCAITTDGATWCWGLNNYGQIGQATVSEACPAFGSPEPCSNSPVLYGALAGLVEISAGTSHSCGLTGSGEIWCWGRGTEGQLGNGLMDNSTAPVAVVRPTQ